MRKFLLMAVLLAFTACSDNDVNSPSTASLVGTYNLVSVNGATLPIVISQNPTTQLVSEQLTVTSDGMFTVTTTKRIVNTGDATQSTTFTESGGGAVLVTGSATTFHFNGGNNATVSLSGNTLMVNTGSSTSLYTR